MTPLLEVRRLGIGFDGKPVVQGVTFTVHRGETLALVGESGSGKTLTAMGLMGLLDGADVSGEAWFETRGGAVVDLLQASTRELTALRGSDIAMVFQEPMTALNPLLSVGAQVAEVLQIKIGLDARSAWREALVWLEKTGIDDVSRRARCLPHQLSGGQRQRVLVAMALAGRPRLLLADEPTTALDASLRVQILELMRALQRELGTAVVLISHDLHLVRRFADRVAVLQRGQLVETGTMDQVMNAPVHPYTAALVKARVGRLVDDAGTADAAGRAVSSRPNLVAHTLGVSYAVPQAGWRGWFWVAHFRAVKALSFTVMPGQTLAVVGSSGSGKSSMALALLNLIAFEGQLSVVDQPWPTASRSILALRRRIQMVFQDPFSSLSPRMTVGRIVDEGLRLHEPQWTAAQRRTRVLEVLDEVGLAASSQPEVLDRYPHQFSGGQRQRIALARVLVLSPDVLVLDEPTSALDVSVQRQILELLVRLQRQRGLSYVLITHDLAVVQAMAHQMLVMSDGCAIEAGPVERVLGSPCHPVTVALVTASAL
jgi:microcin C transport system ATP-binding protein